MVDVSSYRYSTSPTIWQHAWGIRCQGGGRSNISTSWYVYHYFLFVSLAAPHTKYFFFLCFFHVFFPLSIFFCVFLPSVDDLLASDNLSSRAHALMNLTTFVSLAAAAERVYPSLGYRLSNSSPLRRGGHQLWDSKTRRAFWTIFFCPFKNQLRTKHFFVLYVFFYFFSFLFFLDSKIKKKK